MKYSAKEYGELVKTRAPKSPTVRHLVTAFAVGGGICVAGQAILDGYKAAGLDKEAAGGATSMTLIFLGVLFTSLNLYHRLAKHAGAGTLVPITGFANAISSAAIEFRSEGLIFGLAAKMFTIVGPVIVYGISGSVLYGFILLLLGVK